MRCVWGGNWRSIRTSLTTFQLTNEFLYARHQQSKMQNNHSPFFSWYRHVLQQRSDTGAGKSDKMQKVGVILGHFMPLLHHGGKSRCRMLVPLVVLFGQAR